MRRKYLILCILSVFVLNGCKSENVTISRENHEITGVEREKMLENVSEKIFETSDRSNSLANTLEIKMLEVMGEEFSVPSGRYKITREGTGNIFIYDENENLLFKDVLGSFYGIQSVTVDLNETYTVKVNGDLEKLFVVPVDTQLSTSLTAGIWDVGKDIKEGSYTTTTPYGMGYLQIFDPDGSTAVFELIGNRLGASESDINLRLGQKLRITGTSNVNFEPKLE